MPIYIIKYGEIDINHTGYSLQSFVDGYSSKSTFLDMHMLNKASINKDVAYSFEDEIIGHLKRLKVYSDQTSLKQLKNGHILLSERLSRRNKFKYCKEYDAEYLINTLKRLKATSSIKTLIKYLGSLEL